MAEYCAVIGVGQTHHKSKRDDVSIAGLVREAAKMALADADLTWTDIDAVVIGKAPDMFEGNMMPELYLAPALGAVGKPMFRVHTAGSVGGSTSLVAAHLISSGIHKRVLTVAYEKQSDSDAMWALSVPQPFAAPLLAGAGGYFAPHIRAYMRRSGAGQQRGGEGLGHRQRPHGVRVGLLLVGHGQHPLVDTRLDQVGGSTALVAAHRPGGVDPE